MRHSFFLSAGLVSLITFSTGCKDTIQPTLQVNTAPEAFAGEDQMIALFDDVTLRGWATDSEANIDIKSWKKVAGPASYSIESPGSYETKVTNLEQGTYDFELSVTDRGGLTARDTVSVFVYDPRSPGTNELVFKDLKWNCPMGCWLSVQNLARYNPGGFPTRVFLGHATVWTEAVPDGQWTAGVRYSYSFGDNSLFVSSTGEESLTVDVKITD